MEKLQSILFDLFGVVGVIAIIIALIWGILWSVMKFKIVINRIMMSFKYMEIKGDLEHGKLLLDKDGCAVESTLLPYIEDEEKIEICKKAIDTYTRFIDMRKKFAKKG